MQKAKRHNIPIVPVSEAIFLGFARTSYRMARSIHGIIKCVPSP